MKTKRTMAGILAMAMAASALAFNPVFAAGEIGISAEKVSAKAGAEFTLAVSPQGCSVYWGWRLRIFTRL